MKMLHMTAFILLVVGGLNWLVYGLTGWDVGQLFGEPYNMVARVIYVLVGLAAIVEVTMHRGNCKTCNASEPAATPIR